MAAASNIIDRASDPYHRAVSTIDTWFSSLVSANHELLELNMYPQPGAARLR
jgi:tRNA(His) 5'-end guanylyltransferase